MIVLVCGLPGSQKTNLCDILVKRGFTCTSMSKFIYDIMKQNKITITLENLMKQSLRIRRKFGDTYLAGRCIEKIECDKNSKKIVIDSVRMFKEVDMFRSVFSCVVVLAIHSTPKGRYEYMFAHPKSLVKNKKDAERLDIHELELGVGNVILLADYFIFHDGCIDRSEEIELKVLNFLNWLEKRKGD